MLVVVHFLTPADYGIVGMAAAFVAVLQPICDFGIGAAVVQGRGLAREQIGQLHGFAVLLGLICAVVAAAMAVPAAAFFAEPALKAIVPVMALSFFVGSFRIVPSAMLSRQMCFRRLAFIDAAEAVCALVTSIALAVAGKGYWSLVIASVVSRALASVLALQGSPQRILAPTPIAQIARSLQFGAWVVVSSLSWYLYTNSDRVVVGRVLGDAALGAYVMGLSLAAVPVEKVAQLYQRVAESVISYVQHDTATVRRYLLGITEGVAMITFPLSVGLMLVADPFVRIVLGPSWAPCIGPLRVLAAAAALRSLDPLLAQVLIITGRANVNARSMTVATILLPIAFWFGARWGIVGVATVWLIGHPVVVMTQQLWAVLRIYNTRLIDYLGALFPALSSTALMAVAVLGWRAAFGERLPSGLELVSEILSGILVYVASLLLLHFNRVRIALAFVRQRYDATIPAAGTEAPSAA
jgi:O-antigen/teichoic acid export membrane protein